MGKYQYMNLEQKLAKIRKKMPVLLKKYHNDEADYDFATLDDIYESLTPALNKYGVNFDIVKETPTQYGSEGKPVYLTLDKDDYWRYEADLELRWKNIDNPSEMNSAVIHIVGTHEIPDKAHGTALTYGLKYYFRNKFCMRQLGGVAEDPDGMEYGTEESAAGTKKQPSSQDRNEKGRKTVASNPETEAGKGQKHAAESGSGRISGNACQEQRGTLEPENGGKSTKPEPDAHKNGGKRAEKEAEKGSMTGKEALQKSEDPKMSVKNQAQEPKETQAGEGKEAANQTDTAKQPEKAGKQTDTARQAEESGDGFHAAKAEEVPFDESSFLDELEQEMEEQTENADSSLEAAKNYVCTFGLYNGKTLGEMMNSGLKCREAVKWIANRYKGTDKGMVEAAKLLLENQELVAEQQAA